MELMNLNGFPNAVGDFPGNMTGSPDGVLAFLWNRETNWVVSTIVCFLSLSLSATGALKVPKFTKEHLVLKHQGQDLKQHCRETKDELTEHALWPTFRLCSSYGKEILIFHCRCISCLTQQCCSNCEWPFAS